MGTGCADPKSMRKTRHCPGEKRQAMPKRTRDTASPQNTADVTTLKVPTDPAALRMVLRTCGPLRTTWIWWGASARWWSTTKKFPKPNWTGCGIDFLAKAARRRWKKDFSSILTGFRGQTAGPRRQFRRKVLEANVTTVNANVQFIGK